MFFLNSCTNLGAYFDVALDIRKPHGQSEGRLLVFLLYGTKFWIDCGARLGVAFQAPGRKLDISSNSVFLLLAQSG